MAELKDLEAAMDSPGALFGTEVAGGACWHLSLSTKARDGPGAQTQSGPRWPKRR